MVDTLNMSWTFALINNRLAEIYFDRKGKTIVIRGHCYVERSEFTTKREQKYIDVDIKKHMFSYRGKRYRDKFNGRMFAHKGFRDS